MTTTAARHAAAFWRDIGTWPPWHFLPWLVLAASLAVTGQLWHGSREQASEELQADFNFRVREAGARITQRMLAYEQVLRGTSGFMGAERVTRDEFRHYVERLQLQQNYPGIQAISFVMLVPAAQKEQHIAAIRKEGFPGYTLFPPGERAIYSSVIYIEPFKGSNLRALGHDVYSSVPRQTALDQARDFDRAVITSKLTLVQESGTSAQAGFVMYLPVYKSNFRHDSLAQRRANITGWVSAPFRMGDLMAGVHGEKAAELDIEIFDGAQASEQMQMYDSDHDRMKGKAWDARFNAVVPLSVGNREWTMAVRSQPRFDARLDQSASQVVAGAGAGISLLLALLTLLLTTSRERALRAARDMNQELTESESRYRQMFEGCTSIAYLLDPDTGGIVDANPAAVAFWGYPLEQLRQMNIDEINMEAHENLVKAWRKVMDGAKDHMEWRHRLHDGQIRDVEVFICPLDYHGKLLLYAILHDVSDRKRAERALQESEARLLEIAETVGEGLFVIDQGGVVTYMNPEAQRLLGWPENALLGQQAHAAFHHSHPDGSPYPAADCKIDQAAALNRSFRSHDEAFSRKDGSILPVSINATPIVRAGAVVGTVVAFHDIIERKRAEQKLAEESAKNEMLLRTGSDGIHVLDLDGNVVLVNDAFCSMLGYTREEMQHMNVTQWDVQWSVPELKQKLAEVVIHGGLFETRHRRRDGRVIDVEIHVGGVVIGGEALAYAASRDISERKKLTERVHHLANFDLLTDLPNRALFNDRLLQALASARRDQARMALMFIDLDKFKPVNDGLGHQIGDLLLKEVAARMRDCVRESDTVARIGGDEFVVLLPLIEMQFDAHTVADKILHALNEPFELAGHLIRISASIGIAIYPEHGDDDSLLLKHADSAMYRAKQSRGAVVLWED